MTAFDKAELTKHIEVEQILIDAIKLEDQELVRAFESEVRNLIRSCLLTCLQQPTSPAMLELLLNMRDGSATENAADKYSLERAAIKLENPEYLKLLIQHDLVPLYTQRFALAAPTRSPEMFRFLATVQPCIGERSSLESGIGFMNAIIPEKPDVTTEAATLACLEIIKEKLDKSCVDFCLLLLAQRCHTRSIARFCLENGADVDAVVPAQGFAHTPLWFASKFDTREAAELMKFLLTYGANPDRCYERTLLRDRPGPRKIYKWLGVEWDRLVRDCQAGLQPGRP